MAQDPIRELYEMIKSKGYFNDEASFRSFASDAKNRKDIYDMVSAGGYFTDYKTFESFIGPQKKKESSTSGSSAGTTKSSSSTGTTKIKAVDLSKLNGPPKPMDLEVNGPPKPVQKTWRDQFFIEKSPYLKRIEDIQSGKSLGSDISTQTGAKQYAEQAKIQTQVTQAKKEKEYKEDIIKKEKQYKQDIAEWNAAKDTQLDKAEFESFLDEDYKKEYDLFNDITAQDELIANLEAEYAKTKSYVLKSQIELAKANKSMRQTVYDTYRQKVNSEIDAQISELNAQLKATQDADDKKEIQDQINKLNKKKGFFFKTDAEKVAEVYVDVAPGIEQFQVPGDTPQQKMENYAKILRTKAQKIYDEYAGQGGDLGQAFNVLANYGYLQKKSKTKADALESAKSAFGFGKYTDEQIQAKQKELADIDRQLKLMAPVLLLNRAPEISETGSLERFGKSLVRGLAGDAAINALPFEEEKAATLLTAIEKSGVQEDVTDIVNKVTEQQATPPKALSVEGLSGMAGSSIAIIPYIAAAETGLGALRSIKSIGLLADALASTRYGKYVVSHSRFTKATLDKAIMANAVKGGVVAEVAGNIAPAGSTAAEDLDFVSGMFGSLGGQLFEKAASRAIVKGMADKAVNRMFGAAAPEAKKLITAASEKVGSAVGETVEEYGESVGSLIKLYAETGNFDEVKKEFMDQFGTLEKNEEFTLSSFMLGLFMDRSGLGKASMDFYKKAKSAMSPSAQAKMDRFENQFKDDTFDAEVVAKAQDIAANPDAANYTPVTAEDMNKKEGAIQLINDPSSTPDQKVAAAKIIQEVEGKQRAEQVIKSAQTLMSGGETLHAPTEGETFIANPEAKGELEKYTFRDGQWGTVSKDGNYEVAPSEQQQTIQQQYDSQNRERVSSQIRIGEESIKTEPVEGAGQETTSADRDVQAFEKQVTTTDKLLSKASDAVKSKIGSMKNAVKIVASELGLTVDQKSETKAMSQAYNAALAVGKNSRTKAQNDLIKFVEKAKAETAAARVAESLKATGVSVEFVSDQEMIKAQQAKGDKSERGAEGVFLSDDGKILINKEKLEAGWGSTVVWHEGVHPVLNIVRNTNPKLYDAAVRGMKDAIKLNPGAGLESVVDWAETSYTGESTLNDEKLTEAMARIGDGKIDLDRVPKSTKQAIIDFINEISKALGLGRVLTDSSDFEAFRNLAKDITEALTKGKDISKVVGKENVKEFGVKGEAAQKSAVRVMQGKEKMSKYGLKGDKNKTREVGEALEARQREKYGIIDKNDRSQEARKKISSWMMEEIEYFMEAMGENSGKDWYGEKYQKGLDAMAEIFPEMKKDKNARDLFTMLVAITSDGEKVLSNFRLAALAYSEYKKSGNKSLPSKLPGMRQASFSANLGKINSLLDQYKGDIQAIKKDLLETKSIREINAERSKSGLPGLKTDWPVDFNAPFAASVFGPKLGMFYSNLSGQEDYPTLDRWWSRTFNRYRGTVIPEIKRGFNTKGEPIGIDRIKALLKKPKMSDDNAMIAIINNRDSYAARGFKNGTELEKASNTVYKAAFESLNDAPANKTDRQFMYDAVADAVKRLNAKGYDLTIADAQAILWYFEKNLYKTLGVQAKIEGISYEDAAKITVQKFKENNSLNYKIKESEDAAQIEEEDDNIENTEDAIQKSNAPREDLAISKKEATFAPDETRTTEKSSTGKVSFAERVGKPVGPDALQVGKRGVEERGFTKTNLNKSFRIGGRSVNVKASLKVQPSVKGGIKKAIPNAYVDKELLEITGDSDSFHKFISDVKAAHPSGAAVYVYPKEEYADMRLFITPDGKTGLAIKPNGDLVSAFSEYNTGANKKSNRLAQLMVLGVKAGAKKADAFDTVLPDYYSKFGFRVVARVPFSWDAAPEAYTDEYGTNHKAWQKEDFKGFNEGEPDVAMLVYDGGDRATIQNRVGEFEPYSLYKDNLPESSYDEAVELQSKALSGNIQKSQGGREETATIDGVQKRVKPLPGGIDIINGFYSPIEKRIVEFKQPKASVNKWKEIIGVKSDEAVYSGMADWLNSMKPDQQISKEEVQQFMKDNRVEIKEVVKGGVSESDIEAFLNDEAGEGFSRSEAIEQLKENAEAKYEGYTLPGEKEDYKETLVVKPATSKIDARISAIDNRISELDTEMDAVRTYKKVGDTGTVKDFERVVTDPVKYEKIKSELSDLEKEKTTLEIKSKNLAKSEYKSSHWDEKNILVHTRTDVRYDANGDKVLFIEEVQSDWGQEGKKEGFWNDNLVFTDIDQARYQELTERSNLTNEEQVEVDRLLDKMEKNNKNAWSVPSSPYVTDTNAWTKLGLKIALKQAVDAGAKKIAWTTGEQQAARFDLRKQVDTISYSRNPDGKYDVKASKDGVSVSNPLRSATLKDIEKALGKDIAKRIEAGEGGPSKARYMQKDLTGDQLAFGGQGMIGYYGNQETSGILGNVAKALVKELTGVSPEISQTQIAASENPFSKYPALRQESDLTSQPSLEITPELEESVKQGMPQFSKGGREEFNHELAKKIQTKLERLYPEIKLNITNDPVWELSDDVFQGEVFISEEEVNKSLREIANHKTKQGKLPSSRLSTLAKVTLLSYAAWNANSKVISSTIQYNNTENRAAIKELFSDIRLKADNNKDTTVDLAPIVESIWEKSGYPDIEFKSGPGVSSYMPLTNSMTIYRGNSPDYARLHFVAELSHAIQSVKGKLYVGRGVVDFIKAKGDYQATYHMEGAVEHEAHEIIQEELKEEILNHIKDQTVNNKRVGQANLEAMTVLVDAVNQQQDTLPHEYAHHYIAWWRDSPIVKEAKRKWGSEEALVQAIGEQVVKQKGEAYGWWNNFVKWILNKFNVLSPARKRELRNIITDAFLTREELPTWRRVPKPGEIQKSQGGRGLDTEVEYNKSDNITNLKKAINNGLGKDIKLSKGDVIALSKLELNVFGRSTVDNVNTSIPIVIIKKRGHGFNTVSEAVKYLSSPDSDSYDSLSDYFEIVDGRHRIKKAVSNNTGLDAVVITESDYEKYTGAELFSDRSDTREVEKAIDYVYDNIAEVRTLGEAISALRKDDWKLKTGVYLNEENSAILDVLMEESMLRGPQASKGERTPIKETFSQVYNLYNQIQQTEGASKKRSLADQRRAILDANPTAKYIDDNIKTILDQLESNKLATRKGNCP